MANGVSQGTFESNLAYVLDAIHVKYSTTPIFVAKIWGRGFDSACDTLDDVWILDVLSTRNTFAFVGIDERITIKGSDNGDSETYDGVHYSDLGNSLVAVAWKLVLGY